MNLDPEIRPACSEEFERLCVFFTTGELNREESARLEKHLGVCNECRAVIAEYNCLASDGMAKVAAKRSTEDGAHDAEQTWTDDAAETGARNLLLKSLKAMESESGRLETQHPAGSVVRSLAIATKNATFSRVSPTKLLLIAAVLAFLILALGYEFGVKHESLRATARSSGPNNRLSIDEELQSLISQRDTLNSQLAATSQNIDQLKSRAESQEQALNQISGVKASLEQKIQELGTENTQKTDSLVSVSEQRDALQRKLEDAEQSLQNVRTDLKRSQDERQKALLRTASLETRIDDLSAELRDSKAIRHEEQVLASDSEIRDLIGARQLYIADVFDVDQNGQKHRPFGRVFYTKGKSLIFYAFDLDQQPGFRRAKTFQVWGSPGVDEAHAFSLGLFYLDSEANRRWVFKLDDSDLLAQVNTVFVTGEPKGESKSPSGKPILYAYLRAAVPNHP